MTKKALTTTKDIPTVVDDAELESILSQVRKTTAAKLKKRRTRTKATRDGNGERICKAIKLEYSDAASLGSPVTSLNPFADKTQRAGVFEQRLSYSVTSRTQRAQHCTRPTLVPGTSIFCLQMASMYTHMIANDQVRSF